MIPARPVVALFLALALVGSAAELASSQEKNAAPKKPVAPAKTDDAAKKDNAAKKGNAAAKSAKEESINPLLDRAAAQYRDGDFEAARATYEKATKVDLGSIRAWRGLGWSEWSLGRQDRAIRIWNDALRVKPNDRGLLLALAVAAEARKDWSDALARYGRVIEAEPGNTSARLGRARIHFDRQAYAESERDLKAVLDKNPGNFEARFALAQLYRTTNRPEDAKQAFDQLARTPAQPRYLRALADAMLELGRAPEAVQFYKQNLRTQPGNRGTILGLARSYAQLHQYKEAIATLESYLTQHPEDAKIHEELARFAGYAGEYDVAVRHLKQLVSEHPEEMKWQMSLAHALDQAGDAEGAEEIAQKMIKQDPHHAEALEMLVQHARAANQEAEAIRWLERLLEVKPTARRWNDLGDIYLVRGELQKQAGATEDAAESYAQSAEAHRRAAEMDPTDADARLGIATALRLRGDHEEAIEVASGVIRDFPNVERARRELYESYDSLEDFDRAVSHLKATMDLFPNNPRLEHEYARIAFRSGKRAEAVEMVKKMLSEPLDPAVPVLLYHGISVASTREDTMPIANFENQMAALKQRGYESITVQQLYAFLEEGAPLPPKPILITFDDARSDSFRYADPVLAKYGYRATMFIPVGEVGVHGPFNAVWDTIREMKANGRWDMQCHSFGGHHPIQVDGEGKTGVFLANRRWLDLEKRAETTEEFHRRLEEDYKNCGRELAREVPGTQVVGYAFPFGEIGQKGFSNEPTAVTTNEKLAVKYYKMGFVQDSFGFVTRRSNRATLPRFEVPREYTGEDLVLHLAGTNPAVSTTMLLADLHSWDGHFAEAEEVFEQLAKREGVNRAELLARRGRVDLWRGDFASARRSLGEAAKLDPQHRQALAGLDSLELRTRPRMEALGLLYDDNSGRTNIGLGPRGSMHFGDRTVIAAAYRYRQLSDDGFNTNRLDGFGGTAAPGTTTGIGTSAGGLALADSTIPPPETVDLEVQGHEFEAQADYRLDWRTGFTFSGGVAEFRDESSARIGNDPDPFPLATLAMRFPLGSMADGLVSAERGYVGAAGAVLDETGETSGRGRIEFHPTEVWEAIGDLRVVRYDGGNNRQTATAQVLRRFWEEPKVRVGYQFRYDHARDDDPFFYTPDRFIGNDGVLAIDYKPVDVFTLGLITTLGVGQERSGGSNVQTSVIGEGNLQLADRFGLFMSGGRSQAADFESLSLSGGFFLTF